MGHITKMVPRVLVRRVGRVLQSHGPVIAHQRHKHSTAVDKPLRILFCGSDEFSCASLRAINDEHMRNPRGIASIDVMCRPGKPSGRGMKSIRDVPIKNAAQDLGLSLHERDTFTGWTLPQPNGESINLIIAVSFGLFVPPRILDSAEYGGVNVHPSLLPDFRGSAPLYHTLLCGDKYTGVTLQTLHPQKFDHGRILAQTSSPGLEIPNQPDCTYPQLLDFITPKAADMLVQGIRDKLYLPDVKPRYDEAVQNNNTLTRPAPKITPKDRHLNWRSMSAGEILRRDRVLGRLWSYVKFTKEEEKKRVVFSGLELVPIPSELVEWKRAGGRVDETIQRLDFVGSDGKLYPNPVVISGDAIIVPTKSGEAVMIREVTVEGWKKLSAAKAVRDMEPEGSVWTNLMVMELIDWDWPDLDIL